MATNRYERISAGDDGSFEAYCALPATTPAPGVLVFQEIFGVNDNIRELCDRLAAAGYVALAPDMFWRIEPRFERNDESSIADAFAMVQRFDQEKGVADIQAAHAHLRAMSECTGKVGAVGFCLGGGLAFAAAARSGVDATVSYYGSAVNSMLEWSDEIEGPIMFHYGENDPFIPKENIDEVEAVFANRPDAEFFRYAAGHAFSNADAPSMYDAEAAALAWERTLDFFARSLA